MRRTALERGIRFGERHPVSLLAYGFLVPYLVGCAAVIEDQIAFLRSHGLANS